MESKTAKEHEYGNAFITALLGLTATIGAFAVIFERWRTYSWNSRLLGVALLLNLVVIPIMQIKSQRAGKKTKPYESLRISYTWLMLAVLLFNR